MKASDLITPLAREIAHATFDGYTLPVMRETVARFKREGEAMARNGRDPAQMRSARTRYAMAVYMVAHKEARATA